MSQIPDFTAASLVSDAPIAAPSAPTGAAWDTPEGIAVKALYGSADLADLTHLDTIPGAPPYLRGPYPTMYVNQPWTIRSPMRSIVATWPPARRGSRSPST